MRNFVFKKEKFSKNEGKQSSGFSLIELLVVVAIFFILTSIVLLKHSKFSSDILITSAAYEVALFAREAQVYGSGSKVSAAGRVAYGIHFKNSLTDVTLFADLFDAGGNFNYRYDFGIDLPINTMTLKREQQISDFCASGSSGVDCRSDATSLTQMNIAFEKPDLNAHIWGLKGGVWREYKSATIKVKSSLGDKCRTISVTSLGQILVEPVSGAGSGC